jgi:bla regulator protein blaR1
MVHIMSEHVARKLDFSRKLLLTVAALVAIAAPIVFGLVNATPSRAQSQDQTASATAPSFQSFSIKPSDTSSPSAKGIKTRMMYGPDSFVADDVSLQALIQEAYGVQPNQISGPSDLLSATYDVAAKFDPSSGAKVDPRDHMSLWQLALRAALAERTKLVLHHESKVLPVYDLVIAENGPKLQPSTSNGPIFGMSLKQMSAGKSQVVDGAQAVPISDLAQQLSHTLGITVFDKTGLKGNYDFNLKWTESSNQPSDTMEAAAGNWTPPDPSLFTAIEQQLGLKLVPQTQPMDILVIDHIEEPTAD